MAGSNDEPKLLLAALKPFYDFVIPLSWFVVRAAAGWNLLVHSWGKITVGPTPGFLKAFVDIGFTPPAPWFWTALFTETLAGIALILGLFTRFFAAAAADRNADYHRDILAQRIFLAAAGIRIHATLGLDLFCDCIARGRPIFR
ncbi:MAG: DoxX family protein [Pseudolabrys sp.]|jgi:hypothetical protein